jgi:hypothetical protein
MCGFADVPMRALSEANGCRCVPIAIGMPMCGWVP